MTEYESLTVAELLAIAEPDHENLHALRTQAMAARRYVIEIDEVSDMLTDLAGQVEGELAGHFAETFVSVIGELVSNLGVYGYKVHQQSLVVDDIADEAESLYVDLRQYQADRESVQAETGQLSPSQTALVDEMENTLARQRMQDATDYYVERVSQLEPEDEAEPQLQSAAVSASVPSPVASIAPSPGPGGSSALAPPMSGMSSISPQGTSSAQSPNPMRPMTPTPGRPSAFRPAIPPVPRATTPPVIGRRPSTPVDRAPGVRAVRSTPPPVIGERAAKIPPQQSTDWLPDRRGPRAFTDQVLGRRPGPGVTAKPFNRTPPVSTGDGLNRPVIGRRVEPTVSEAPAKTDKGTWAVSTSRVDAVIGVRHRASDLHHPGPVALTGGPGRLLSIAPMPRAVAAEDGLLERLKRVNVRSVTADRRVAARLSGTGDLSFDFGPVGADMGALARAVRSAMVAALRGGDAAAARIVGQPLPAPNPTDPLASVTVEARSRLGYVHIRWCGWRDITVSIDSRARGRLNDEQLLSEVNHAATTVLRRHREHLVELNRRLIEATESNRSS